MWLLTPVRVAGPDPRVFTPARRAGRLLLEMVGEEEIEALDEGAADAAALAARPAPPPPSPLPPHSSQIASSCSSVPSGVWRAQTWMLTLLACGRNAF